MNIYIMLIVNYIGYVKITSCNNNYRLLKEQEILLNVRFARDNILRCQMQSYNIPNVNVIQINIYEDFYLLGYYFVISVTKYKSVMIKYSIKITIIWLYL